MLLEELKDDINGRVGAAEKTFSNNFSKANITFCLGSHYNHDNSYLFVDGKEIYKLKADNKSDNILT